MQVSKFQPHIRNMSQLRNSYPVSAGKFAGFMQISDLKFKIKLKLFMEQLYVENTNTLQNYIIYIKRS